MERLRDKKNAPGSLEAELVEAIKIDMRKSAERRPVARAQQRNVLEAVLDHRRARDHWAKLLLRPMIVGGLLLAAGATVAMVGRSRMAPEPRGVFPQATRPEPIVAKPIGRATTEQAEVEAAPVSPAKPSEAALARSISRPASTARTHVPAAVEDPAYVGGALRVLRTDHDPARALRLLATYLKTYPRGMLSEEALALSIEAAMDLGSPSAATFAQRYMKEYPNGRFREAAIQALGHRPL
jgi:hypothetical protein